eukprot:GHVU01178241.1.p1 GENE.GHVU01178241.1~~GHVU01178241.1.p1  ORF type:complete len:107 (+),score=5.01 GHVU01178241.1:114-434(+)
MCRGERGRHRNGRQTHIVWRRSAGIHRRGCRVPSALDTALKMYLEKPTTPLVHPWRIEAGATATLRLLPPSSTLCTRSLDGRTVDFFDYIVIVLNRWCFQWLDCEG